MSDRVTINVENHIANVRFNRPEKVNALDPKQFNSICDVGERLAEMKHVRVVVLAGEGNGFCAGLDLDSVQSTSRRKVPNVRDAVQETASFKLETRTHGNTNRAQQATHVWRKLHCPVIAAIHGACFGGGLQIASGADIRVVAPDAVLSIMELRWGLIPDMGSFSLWRTFVRDDILRELVYTARKFSGEEALGYGFASHLDMDPVAKANELAKVIASRNPDAVRAAKRIMNRTYDMSEDQILLTESIAQDRIWGLPNQIEAVMAEKQRRPANFLD